MSLNIPIYKMNNNKYLAELLCKLSEYIYIYIYIYKGASPVAQW